MAIYAPRSLVAFMIASVAADPAKALREAHRWGADEEPVGGCTPPARS